MNMNQNIFEIIAAELNGEQLTDNEKYILDRWLKESPKNKNIYQEYYKIYQNKDDIYSFKGIDANKAWNKHLSKVKSSRTLNLRTLLKYAALVIPIVVASTIFFNWGKWDIFSDKNYCNLVVPKGLVQEVILADGTKVWINADSELKYPKKFKGNRRQVYLKGEAYFSVTKNKEKPFIVKSNFMDIKVLGTEFNLSCYDNSNRVEATLFEGKIAYSTKDSKGILEPGTQVVYNKTNNKTEVRSVDVSKYISWKDGIYIFDGIKIEDLANKISRWYNIEVEFKSNEAKTMEFSGAMEKNRPVDFIIELLEETNSVKCEIKEGVLYIDVIQ